MCTFVAAGLQHASDYSTRDYTYLSRFVKIKPGMFQKNLEMVACATAGLARCAGLSILSAEGTMAGQRRAWSPGRGGCDIWSVAAFGGLVRWDDHVGVKRRL